MSTVQTKQTNLREKLAELLDFRKMRDRLSGLGLYIGKDRTGTDENLLVRGGANVDDLQIGEIAALVGGTAVDVFVYDTSRDSDGGAWRKRTQHTSWYNEELNTATRGGRREFPAVAVIVAEAYKVTIYDGDDPDLSMWMVFNADVAGKLLNTIGGNTSLAALNGDIFVGCNERDLGGVSIKIAFISDTSFAYARNQITQWPTGISGRDTTVNYTIFVHSYGLVNLYVNDVAMTVLPNAPIDENTGLPVPTIAVACGDGTYSGFSIINHDGTVANKSYTGSSKNQSVSFTSDNRLVVSQKRNDIGDIWVAVYDNLTTSTSINGTIVHDSNISIKYNDINYLNRPNILSGTTDTVSNKYIMSNSGLSLLDPDEPYIGSYVDGNPVNIYGMAAYVTSKYNTGWMPGDIKLATLSDTTVETIGVNSDNLLTGDSSTFDSGTGGWASDSGAVLTHNASGGYLQVGNGGGDNTFACRKYIYFDTSKNYIITARVRPTFTGSYRFRVRIGANEPYSTTSELTSGQWTEISTTVFSTEANWLEFGSDAGTITTFDIDDITIRATTELITNGDFSIDVTASDGQTSGGWTSKSAQLSIESGRLKIVDAGSTSAAYQAINTIAGKKYVLSLSGQFNDDVDGRIEARDATFSGTLLNSIDPVGLHQTPTEFSLTFVAQSSNTVVLIGPASGNGDTATIDNVSVRPAEEDRSVNNNGLQIIGEIDKTPVAPGADLVAYSGFSANDYLMQPYNEDLDGLNSFSIMGWVKRNDTITSEQPFVSFKDTSDDGVYSNGDTYMLFGTTQNHELFLQTHEQSTSTDAAQTVWSSQTLAEGVWTNFCLVYDESTTTTKIFINGRMVNSATKSTGPVYLSNSVMTIGSRFKPTVNGHVCDQVDLSLIRISATVPTDAQIAKIYRDEKVLFQDGAQATLYGSSDAVTALAYDEKTELLHVGTASGRSDFSGLRRINNTTTAITTSISAHNNLIAEQ